MTNVNPHGLLKSPNIFPIRFFLRTNEMFCEIVDLTHISNIWQGSRNPVILVELDHG